MRKYLFAILAAAVYGTLLTMPFMSEGRYQSGDEAFYLARIQDAVDGHRSLSNAYLWEKKDGLPAQLFLAENILALPLRAFNIPVASGYVAYTGLLGAGMFFLSYIAFRTVSRSSWLALLGTSVMFVGLYMTRMIRPVSPQFNFLFFITEFLFLWHAVGDGRWRWFILGGINLGLLFYIYPYYWTAYLVLIALMALNVVVKERPLWKRFAVLTVITALLSIPYAYLSVLSLQLPEYTQTLTRLGLIYSHIPSGIKILLWSAVPFGLILLAIKKRVLDVERETWFLMFALLAHPIAANQ